MAAVREVGRRWRASLLPDVRLSERAFRSRHRVLRVILCLQVPLLILVWRFNRSLASMDTGDVVAPLITAVLVCIVASLALGSRRVSSAAVSIGLLLAAAGLVHVSGGLTDLHFQFFLVVGLISLYQDWRLLLVSVVLVAAHHLITGLLDPTMLYSDPYAQHAPIRFAVIHSAFVLAMCAVQLAYWRFAHVAQVEQERIVRLQGDRFEALVHDSYDVIMVVDRDGLITTACGAVEPVLGRGPGDLVGTRYDHLLLAPLPSSTVDSDREVRLEVPVRHADGGPRWHEVTLRDLTGHPAVAGVVVNHRDITERRMFQERLAYEASHDGLTGLVNRAELLRRLDQALGTAPPDAPGIGVLYLDLNGFKQVNDSYGHETGDALLIAVAGLLHRCVLGGDTVGRLGGDEFAIVLSNIDRADDAVAVARRIVAEFAGPVAVAGTLLVPSTSIGIALASASCRETDQLLHRADTAMYHAKRAGGESAWQLYVAGMHDPTAIVATLEDELRRAIQDDQLRVQYQPIVELASGELRGFEVLLRWQHPTRGLLPPAEFIPLAEQSDIINDLGRWVLRQSVAQVAAWQSTRPGARPLYLSANLAPRQLQHPGLVAEVLDLLARNSFRPEQLVLEVTESAVAKGDFAVPALAGLREAGIRIALDDFGTGYSSLRYLTRLPISALKLDRCFVAELNGTPQGAAVAEAVTRLGRILRLDTIAEGVEHAEQVAELTRLGCDAGQGYYYSRPLDAPMVDRLLARAAESGGTTGIGAWPRLPEALVAH